MKTFIAALIIFALLLTLVLTSAFCVQKQTSELLLLAYALPSSAEDFGGSEIKEKTLALLSLWKERERGLAYIIYRDTLDKASEAVSALYTAAEAESAEDFLPARLRFIAAIERISLLFSVSAESIL
jgi:hypothetical protein